MGVGKLRRRTYMLVVILFMFVGLSVSVPDTKVQAASSQVAASSGGSMVTLASAGPTPTASPCGGAGDKLVYSRLGR